MITAALIRHDFVADTLRRNLVEITTARPVPHRVCRLLDSKPFEPLPETLKPFAKQTVTAHGLQVALLSGLQPMAIKYPENQK